MEKKGLERSVEKKMESKKGKNYKEEEGRFERELGRMEDMIRRNTIERTIEEKIEGVVRNIREKPRGTDKNEQGVEKLERKKEKIRQQSATGGDGVDAEAPALPLPALIEIRGDPGITYAGALSKIKEKAFLGRHGVKDVAVRVTPKGAALITIKRDRYREKGDERDLG